MNREEAKQNSEVKTKTAEDVDTNFRSKRSHVPTEEEAYIYRVAYSRIPNVNLRRAETEKSMKDGAPWLLTEDWAPKKRTLETDTSGLRKRILSLGEKRRGLFSRGVFRTLPNICDEAFFRKQLISAVF